MTTPAAEDDVNLADSVGLALLVVLESLGPSERLAFVLHDLFAVPFDEIGQILGESTAATKMLASRARRKVQATERPTARREQQQVVQAFLAAARGGDFEALLRALDPEVRLTVDSADGVVVPAASGQGVMVNGLPRVLARKADGTPVAVLAFTVVDARIVEIETVTDPAKLVEVASGL